ncbi:unnamed protein product [Polarella glacialis]|uniref:Uncharacterized protein n=1 Tax=Polarella glacialis TaxID=89957 RepID=A0A813LJ10_POLGL|nr:unnamed protein product [Polarella glacialis]
MKMKSDGVTLVGDHRQLPPTVSNVEARGPNPQPQDVLQVSLITGVTFFAVSNHAALEEVGLCMNQTVSRLPKSSTDCSDYMQQKCKDKDESSSPERLACKCTIMHDLLDLKHPSFEESMEHCCEDAPGAEPGTWLWSVLRSCGESFQGMTGELQKAQEKDCRGTDAAAAKVPFMLLQALGLGPPNNNINNNNNNINNNNNNNIYNIYNNNIYNIYNNKNFLYSLAFSNKNFIYGLAFLGGLAAAVALAVTLPLLSRRSEERFDQALVEPLTA